MVKDRLRPGSVVDRIPSRNLLNLLRFRPFGLKFETPSADNTGMTTGERDRDEEEFESTDRRFDPPATLPSPRSPFERDPGRDPREPRQ
jgi:hypothetical protein